MAANLAHLDDSNFEAETSKGVTLVDFYATWCGPCRMIAPVVERLATSLQGKAKVAKLDIDQAQHKTAELRITSVPTLIVFKDGQEVERVVGVKDFDYLDKLVGSYL